MEPLSARVDRQRAALARRAVEAPAIDEGAIEVAVAPYRVCPIGAHSDHQGGPVLGIGISAGTLLAFAPTDDASVRVHSEDFPGEARFTLPAPPPPSSAPASPEQDWRRYVEAAAWVLRERLPARPRGLVGLLHGSLPGGGLSSSASVLLAYLLAFARVNALHLSPEERVALARRAENEYVGVASGILDPASIVGAQRDRLLFIDTKASLWHSVPLGPGARPHRILVAYSGVSRNLAATPFNLRVEECRSAARLVAARAAQAGRPELDGVELLGDLPEPVLEAHLEALPRAERGRARHFLGERRRVLAGAEAWRAGELERFGELMNESCDSSITQYETGSEDLVELQRILLRTPGVLGARFSGAGFGGCSIALVDAGAAVEACARVEREFLQARPALAGKARAFLVESEDGARLV